MASINFDPYATLEISGSASHREIKQAYRRLALLHHPDKNPHQRDATERFQRISAAWEILSNQSKRDAYDAMHRKSHSTTDSYAHPRDSYTQSTTNSNTRKPTYSDSHNQGYQPEQPAAEENGESKRKREDHLRWLRIQEDKILKAKKVVAALKVEIQGLAQQDRDDEAKESLQDSWWRILMRQPKMTEDEKMHMASEKIQRMAASRIKLEKLGNAQKELQELERLKRKQEEVEIARLERENAERVRRWQESEKRRRAQEEAKKLKKQKEAQEAAERMEREMAAERQARAKAAKEARERWERLRAEERRAQEKAAEEARKQQEHDAEQRRQKTYDENFPKFTKKVEREREPARAKAPNRRQPTGYTTRSADNKPWSIPTAIPTPCKHKCWWDRIDGCYTCKHCTEVRYKFAMKCTRCGSIACVSCMKTLKAGGKPVKKSHMPPEREEYWEERPCYWKSDYDDYRWD